MTDVMKVMLEWLTSIFQCLLDYGGIIGIAIICWPLFKRIVRAVRSIINR